MRLNNQISAIALGGLLALGSLAAQAGPLSLAGSTPAISYGLMSSSAPTDFALDVAGIFSFDGSGDPDNVIRSLQIGANARVIGIGWDTLQFADAPSYLSEMVVGFGSSTTMFANLITAIGDDSSGTQSYNSGGVIDLVPLGLDFSVGADGTLRVEFYESLDDFANDWDGRWERGSLTIRVEGVRSVPEPPVYALVFLGLAVAAGTARRRARQ